MSAEQASQSQPQAAAKKITVRNGINERKVDSGMTVGQYREKYGSFLGIPEGAKAYSGNQELKDTDTIDGSLGDVLEFVKKAGEKG